MCSKFKYFIVFLGIFILMIIPKNVFASTNITGAFTLYNKWTSNGTLGTGYDSTNAGISYPNTSSWLDLPAMTNANYRVVTAMDIQANYNFIAQNDYTLRFHFENGGYVYPAWPYNNSESYFIGASGCPGKKCTTSWSYVQGSLDLTIKFTATSNSSSVTFNLGNTTDNLGMFYNAYTSTQGLRIYSANLDEVDNSINFGPLIDSQNQNTQDIINNNNQNTTTIINNQNENTEIEIESQKVCSFIDKKNVVTNGYLDSSGTLHTGQDIGVTDFINVESSTLTLLETQSSIGAYLCFYNTNKSLISCVATRDYSANSSINIPNNTSYIKATIVTTLNKPTFKLCKNGNQALSDDINSLNKSLTDSNVDVGGELLDVDWYENSHFSSIITSPIQFLNSLNGQCSPVVLPLFGKNISLPCGTTIFWDLDNTYITNFRAFWNLLFGGLIIYRLALSLIMHINNALDPTKDEIGGLDI